MPPEKTDAATAPEDETTEPTQELGDGGKKALEAERKARRDAEKRLAVLEAKNKERDEAELTETEKLRKELEQVKATADKREAEYRSERVRTSTVRAAAKLGYADPDDAFRLIDSDSVEDDGSNVDKLLGDLLKSKPYLASSRVAGSADGGQRGTDKPTLAPGMERLQYAYAQSEPSGKPK